MTQRWHDLLFAHWAVPPDQLRAVLPPVLPLDTFDGRAWIGVVPFRMTGVRPRGVPPLPGLSAFPELNVRTYVTMEGKPGVYFFSLDAASALAVAAARWGFGLPYFRARMAAARDRESIAYRSRRTHRGAPPAALAARYRPLTDVRPSRPGTIEYWLTERYCLYTVNARQHVSRLEIHHRPWPLQAAEAEFEINTMTAPLGVELRGEPLLHFARFIQMYAWLPQAALRRHRR
jgi:uncharacterized protein